jgi:hypothetical protein
MRRELHAAGAGVKQLHVCPKSIATIAHHPMHFLLDSLALKAPVKQAHLHQLNHQRHQSGDLPRRWRLQLSEMLVEHSAPTNQQLLTGQQTSAISASPPSLPLTIPSAHALTHARTAQQCL